MLDDHLIDEAFDQFVAANAAGQITAVEGAEFGRLRLVLALVFGGDRRARVLEDLLLAPVVRLDLEDQVADQRIDRCGVAGTGSGNQVVPGGQVSSSLSIQ